MTTSSGRFVIEAMIGGIYTWRFDEIPAGAAVGPSSFFVDSASAEITYRFLPARRLRIIVTSPDGYPFQRCNISYYKGDDLVRANPDRETGLYPWPLDCTLGRVSQRDHATRIFEVAEDQEEVTIVLQPGCALRFRLLDAAGNGIADHPYRIDPLGGGVLHEPLRNKNTSGSGRGFTTLPLGRYRVTTTLPDGRALGAEVMLDEVGGQVEIELEELGSD